MQTYLKIIRNLIQSSKTVSPEAIWRGLCETYSSKTKMKNYFYPCNLDCVAVTDWFARSGDFPNIITFFQTALNTMFEHQKLNPDGEFVKMLQAFLTYFPEYRNGLIENILPAALPAYVIEARDFNDIFTALQDVKRFCRAAPLITMLIQPLSFLQLKLISTLIAGNLGNDDPSVAVSARECLARIYALRSDVNLVDYINYIYAQLKDADYFIRKKAIWNIGELARIKEFDLAPLLIMLEEQVTDENLHVRMAVIHTLALIYRERKKALEVFRILSLFRYTDSRRVIREVNLLRDEINGYDRGCRYLNDSPVKQKEYKSPPAANELCDQTFNIESQSDITLLENSVRAKIALLQYLQFDALEKILGSLLEIANLRESVAISLILPALCKAVETAETAQLEIFTKLLEKLSTNLKKYFMLGLLTPRLEEVMDTDVRLNLLLVRQNICQEASVIFLLKCDQDLSFVPSLPSPPQMFEHKSF